MATLRRNRHEFQHHHRSTARSHQQDLAQLRSTMEKAKSLIGSIQSVVRGNDDNIRDNLTNQLTDHVNHQPRSLVRIRQPKDRKVPK